MEKLRRASPFRVALWAAALAFSAGPLGFAADTETKPGETERTRERSSGVMNVSDTDIRQLRERGYSWGDIGRALVISEECGKQLTEITSLRDSGLDWPEIANRNHVPMFQEKPGRKGRNKGTRREPEMREAPSGSRTQPQQPGTSPTTEPGGTPPSVPPGDGSRGGSPGTTNPAPQRNRIPPAAP